MDIKKFLDDKDFNELKKQLENKNIADIAMLFEDIEDKDKIILFKLLNKDIAAEVFSYLNPDMQETIITAIKDSDIQNIMKELYLDDATDFIQEMPANVVKRVLKNVDNKTREQINKLLSYPDNSAGSIMTTEFIDLKSNLTVSEAFEKIRRKANDSETVYTIYITDEYRKISGVVSIRDLLIAKNDAKLKDIMETNVITANTLTDKEDIANMFSKYDFYTLPILDNEQRLVGIVTADDVMEVIQDEATEDMEKMAAITPSDESYLKTSVFKHAKKRVFWLLLLTLSASITGAIISHFEDAFVLVPVLVSFIPMLMDTGGNCGSQASTLIIRGLALGEIKTADYLKIMFKEFRVSLVCGVILSIVNFFVVWLRSGDPLVGLVVALTLLITICVAKFIGGMLPILAKKIKLDPAIMAAPIISTLVDCITIVCYFLIATAILGL